jgi:hypothetical protein
VLLEKVQDQWMIAGIAGSMLCAALKSAKCADIAAALAN